MLKVEPMINEEELIRGASVDQAEAGANDLARMLASFYKTLIVGSVAHDTAHELTLQYFESILSRLQQSV